MASAQLKSGCLQNCEITDMGCLLTPSRWQIQLSSPSGTHCEQGHMNREQHAFLAASLISVWHDLGGGAVISYLRRSDDRRASRAHAHASRS